MIITLSALILIVAAGIGSLRKCWLVAPALAAICWFGVVGVKSYYSRDFDISREDLRGATRYVLAHAQTGDVVAFYKGQGRFAFSYYADHINGVLPRIVYPGSARATWRDFVASPTSQVLESLAKQNGRVWLVVSETLGPEGEDATAQEIKHALETTHYLGEIDGLRDLKIYRYDVR
jgi:hypothetical protein